jgi:hypothetical protein
MFERLVEMAGRPAVRAALRDLLSALVALVTALAVAGCAIAPRYVAVPAVDLLQPAAPVADSKPSGS